MELSLYKIYQDVRRRLGDLEEKFPDSPELVNIRQTFDEMENNHPNVRSQSFFALKGDERSDVEATVKDMQKALTRIESSLNISSFDTRRPNAKR